MGNYISNFETTAELAEFSATTEFKTPHVSLTKDSGEVHYFEYDYSKDYLTTVALGDGTISFNIWKSMGTDMITSISYSTDNGESWTTTNNVNDKEEHLTISVGVSEGDKVLWKGDAQRLGYMDNDDYGDYVGSFFSSDCEFNVQGNVMSMLYGDDFVGEETLEYDYMFAYLFSDYDEEHECLVVSAEHMVLPATELAYNCYSSMFQGCINLTTAPSVLPATTLANWCYMDMFRNCTSLTTAPELPATTLADMCYHSMFYNTNVLPDCTNIDFSSQSVLASGGLRGLFAGTKVTDAQLDAILKEHGINNYSLPVTTLTKSCYVFMFQGCTSLTTAPKLPATTLASSCYQSMFQGCTSLTTAPELPATTLANVCYINMFQGCTSLTTAPELPATRLVDMCYFQMFRDCSSLSSIKCLATNISASYCTNSWVYGVASSGTFTKASSMSGWTTSDDGIPSGWTVVNA